MKGKKLTVEDKREIVRLRIGEKMSPLSIAEKFGIAKQTVLNIVCEWKEFVDVDTDITDELHDTDIDAYMSDRKVEEPAPAATEASSKQEIVCENIPDYIIPEKAQIVKPIIPYGVKEACRVRLDYLKDLIAEEQAVIDNWTAEMKEITEFLEENKEDVDNV